ncbi:peroxisomal membrane anchor protein conserved region-domain-containing protein [Hyaloraphidium curvatum]|nr:peroxisomal membrane anchor protein conserved region-domain-containing protein [Hyaloraphidium curvatum]
MSTSKVQRSLPASNQTDSFQIAETFGWVCRTRVAGYQSNNQPSAFAGTPDACNIGHAKSLAVLHPCRGIPWSPGDRAVLEGDRPARTDAFRQHTPSSPRAIAMSSDDGSAPPDSSDSPPAGGSSGSEGFAAERMTPEQRAEIRRKLLEKQRAAREGTAGEPAPPAASPDGASPPAPGTTPPAYSAETGTTVPPRTASGIPAWQLKDADELLGTPGVPSDSGSAAPAPAPAPAAPLRENLVGQAVSFLSSAKVQSSPKDRQDAFLKNKGLNDAEIAEARRRVAGGAPSPSASPSGTPAPAAPQPGTYTGATPSSEALAAKLQAQQSAQSQAARAAAEQAAREAQERAMQAFLEAKKKREEALARRKVQDYILMAIVLGGGALGIANAVKSLVINTYTAFWNLYAAHLSHKRTLVIDYLTQLAGFLGLYKTPAAGAPATEGKETIPAALERFTASVDALSAAQERISSHARMIKDRWIPDPPIPRYSYGPPEPAEDTVPSDFKTVRRWLDASKRACESEAYFSAASAYGLGGGGGYWSGSGSSEEKNKSEAARALHATITDIKSDLRALKGQLLSRKNFPTTANLPTFSGLFSSQSAGSTGTAAAIPAWQQSSADAPPAPQVNGDAQPAQVPSWNGPAAAVNGDAGFGEGVDGEAVRNSLVAAEEAQG